MRRPFRTAIERIPLRSTYRPARIGLPPRVALQRRQVEWAGPVVDAHDKVVDRRRPHPSQRDLEWKIRPRVASHEMSVQPHRGPVVDRFEASDPVEGSTRARKDEVLAVPD